MIRTAKHFRKRNKISIFSRISYFKLYIIGCLFFICKHRHLYLCYFHTVPTSELLLLFSILLIVFLKLFVNNIAVVSTAIASANGSAIYTAIALFSKNIGSMYISGIKSSIFLSIAKNKDVFAFPMANKCLLTCYLYPENPRYRKIYPHCP